MQEKTGTPGEMAEMDEITGYLPWYFGLPFQFEGDAQVKRMGAAFSRLFDRECFYAPYGPSTCSRYPGFLEKKGCASLSVEGWSWPFSTSQTLTAAAESSAREPGEKRKYRIWKKRIRGTAPFVCRFPLQNRQVRKKVLLDR